jgi:phage shock protein A
MHTIQKILISLKTRMNNVVDDFENHEALAAVAIEEVEKIGRNSRIQINRIRNRIEGSGTKIETRKQEAEKWAERAVKLEATDQEAAINCVKRMKEAEKEIETLERQQREAIAQEKKIVADLARISEQIGSLKTRRENLISRQHRVQATGTTARDGRNPAGDAKSVFERWENRLLGDEFEIPAEEPGDPFAERFEQEEYEADLKATLASLVEKSRKS